LLQALRNEELRISCNSDPPGRSRAYCGDTGTWLVRNSLWVKGGGRPPDSGDLSVQQRLAEWDRSPRLHLAWVADVILARLEDDILALGCQRSKEFVHALPRERNAAHVNSEIEHRGPSAVVRVAAGHVIVGADE
jgi:hypothetical protein